MGRNVRVDDVQSDVPRSSRDGDFDHDTGELLCAAVSGFVYRGPKLKR